MMGQWKGFKELVLTDKIKECEEITSFYFKAKDGGKVAMHQPGQFLPFKLQTEDEKYKDVLRTYSLSNYPNEAIYRISVKRIEDGLMSSYLHDHLNVGDVIEAMVPTGLFTLNENHLDSQRPVVLISGGIGVTPILSMAYHLAHDSREVHSIQAVQNSAIHPFKHDLEALAQRGGLRTHVFYSNPLEKDVLGKDYDQTGYVNKEWLAEHTPLDADFYFCGPPVFMKALEKALLELGVKQEAIHYEYFSA